MQCWVYSGCSCVPARTPFFMKQLGAIPLPDLVACSDFLVSFFSVVVLIKR